MLLENQKSIAKWQKQWDDSNKGWVTKEYFPEVKERLKKKINLSPNFTAMLTAHGKTKAYLLCFKITVSRMRLCQRRPNCGPPHIQLSQTGQGKRKTNSIHIERRRLASAEI
jgi:hypothetical protein